MRSTVKVLGHCILVREIRRGDTFGVTFRCNFFLDVKYSIGSLSSDTTGQFLSTQIVINLNFLTFNDISGF